MSDEIIEYYEIKIKKMETEIRRLKSILNEGKRESELIEYYEIVEDRMARDIRRLKHVILEKNKKIKFLELEEKKKNDIVENKLKMTDFDDCIEGVVERFGQEYIICYNKIKVIEKLMVDMECSYNEAIEFYEFNQLGSWVGDSTPCFIDKDPQLIEKLKEDSF